MRSRSPEISVPLPTPEGPVITKTFAMSLILPYGGAGTARLAPLPADAPRALAAQHVHQLGALALGEAADCLRR